MTTDKSRQTTDKLTLKQVQAARLLALGCTQAATAVQIGVTTRTVERWAVLPQMQQFVQEIQGEAHKSAIALSIDQLRERIDSLAPKAITVVEEILGGLKQKPSDRLRAALIASEWAGFKYFDVNTSISFLAAMGYQVTLPEDCRYEEKQLPETFDEES